MTESRIDQMDDGVKMALDIRAGSRRALSNAITLVESTRTDHQDSANQLLDQLVRTNRREGIRIAVSGTPGAGKSTIIDALGAILAEHGHSVAVLAVDPSSVRTGGSILGDKTRMGKLARFPQVYIRPSPNNLALGGVATRTGDVVFLCEQAGFDHVLIETTGVGQSEIDAADFSDIFMLVVTPAGGDELQGVKRGIIEVADLVVVNKADGVLLEPAAVAAGEYRNAIRLFPRRRPDLDEYPAVLTVSARENSGLDTVLDEIRRLAEWRRSNGHWQAIRRAQDLRWLESQLRELILAAIEETAPVRQVLHQLERKIDAGSSIYSAGVRGELARLAKLTASRFDEGRPKASRSG